MLPSSAPIKRPAKLLPVLYDVAHAVASGLKSGHGRTLDLNAKKSLKIAHSTLGIVQVILVRELAHAAVFSSQGVHSLRDGILAAELLAKRAMDEGHVFDAVGAACADSTSFFGGDVAVEATGDALVVEDFAGVFCDGGFKEILAILPDDAGAELCGKGSPFVRGGEYVHGTDLEACDEVCVLAVLEEGSCDLEGLCGVEGVLMIDGLTFAGGEGENLRVGIELREDGGGAGMAHENEKEGSGRSGGFCTRREGSISTGEANGDVGVYIGGGAGGRNAWEEKMAVLVGYK